MLALESVTELHTHIFLCTCSQVTCKELPRAAGSRGSAGQVPDCEGWEPSRNGTVDFGPRDKQRGHSSRLSGDRLQSNPDWTSDHRTGATWDPSSSELGLWVCCSTFESLPTSQDAHIPKRVGVGQEAAPLQIFWREVFTANHILRGTLKDVWDAQSIKVMGLWKHPLL